MIWNGDCNDAISFFCGDVLSGYCAPDGHDHSINFETWAIEHAFMILAGDAVVNFDFSGAKGPFGVTG